MTRRTILIDPLCNDDYVLAVSALLRSCANDLKESCGGHLPDSVVDTVIQRIYATPVLKVHDTL